MHVWDIGQVSCFTRWACCLLSACASVAAEHQYSLPAMQAYATLAAEPYPSDVKRFSWVLPQKSPPTLYLWPELNDALSQETVRRVHEVRLLALLCCLPARPACLPACLTLPPRTDCSAACLPACLPACRCNYFALPCLPALIALLLACLPACLHACPPACLPDGCH